MTSDHSSQLAAIATYLLKRRDAILDAWRVRAERQGSASVVARLTRTEFYDHIPSVLNALHAELRRPDGKQDAVAAKAASDHGAHRWQQGLDLLEVTREWGHLHRALLPEVEAFHASRPDVSTEVMAIARDVVAQIIHDGVAQSVTEYHRLQRIEAEARARDLEAALARNLETGRTRGMNLRVASHDLRGSLSIIRSATDVLSVVGEGFDHDEMVGLISTAADDLTAMLADLLDLARLEAELETRQIEAFDVASLLKDLCQSSRPLAEAEGLAIAGHGPVSLAVRSDRVKVLRIAQNLILNALKYTKVGGVEVTWQGDPHQRWSFSVRDTGPGMPVGNAAEMIQMLEQATEKAHETSTGEGTPAPDCGISKDIDLTTNDECSVATLDAPMPVSQVGEGIGLSIVRKLCDLLEGSLEVESRPNCGTTFRVLLPRDYPH